MSEVISKLHAAIRSEADARRLHMLLDADFQKQKEATSEARKRFEEAIRIRSDAEREYRRAFLEGLGCGE